MSTKFKEPTQRSYMKNLLYQQGTVGEMSSQPIAETHESERITQPTEKQKALKLLFYS